MARSYPASPEPHKFPAERYNDNRHAARFLKSTILLSLALAGCSSGEDSEAECAEEYPPFHCVRSGCGGDVVNTPACKDGAWVCPAGWVPPSECPDDACFHPPVYSCCDEQGNRSSPTCPNQAGEQCSGGSTLVMNFGASCPKAGEFVCDYGANCKLDTEFCLHHPTGGACQPIPAECGSNPTCECLKASTNCFSCEDSGDGEIAVSC